MPIKFSILSNPFLVWYETLWCDAMNQGEGVKSNGLFLWCKRCLSTPQQNHVLVFNAILYFMVCQCQPRRQQASMHNIIRTMNYRYEIDTPLGTCGELLKTEFEVLITSSSLATNKAWAMATTNGRFSNKRTHIYCCAWHFNLKLLIFLARKKLKSSGRMQHKAVPFHIMAASGVGEEGNE